MQDHGKMAMGKCIEEYINYLFSAFVNCSVLSPLRNQNVACEPNNSSFPQKIEERNNGSLAVVFQFLVSTRAFNTRAFLISCLFLKKHKIIAVLTLREHWPPFSRVKVWHMEHEASKCMSRPLFEHNQVQSVLERKGKFSGKTCSGMKVFLSRYLCSSSKTFSRALQSVIQEYCMCFPENTKEEQLTGVRNHRVHRDRYLLPDC